MPKLLLADDSVTIQRVIELTFSGEDVQVVAVGDGEQAIARIPSERPDIVLADIGMPKRSGYDVAAFVKATPDLSHIPVLLLAGAFEPVDQARADQVRCDGVVVKPFEPQQLVARVRELVAGGKARALQPGALAARHEGRTPAPEARGGTGAPQNASGPAPSGTPEARVVDSRPIVELPEPSDASGGPPTGETGDSLDDYFDRLDAAFASLGNGGTTAPGPSATLDDFAGPEVPTIDALLGGVAQPAVPGEVPSSTRLAAPPVEPPDSPPTMAGSQARGDGAAGSPARQAEQPAPGADEGRSVIADVFSALLAAEQGDDAAARHLASAPNARPASDDLVEEVTRRVLERLTPGAVKDLVADVVGEVAERLVREEIARIRGTG